MKPPMPPDDEMPDEAMMDGPAATDDEPEGNVTPEEQELYKKFVTTALVPVYMGLFDQVVAYLRDGDPIDNVASMAVMLVMRTEQAAEQAGVELDPQILLQGGGEIISHLCEIATKSGIHDFDANPDDMEAASLRAVDQYRLVAQESGRLDPNVMQQDLADLQRMDQDGTLEQTLMGLAETREAA